MVDNKLIYVKIEPGELVESKRAVLWMEMGLIKILQALRKYRALRYKELYMKSKLRKSLKDLRLIFKKFDETLPEYKIHHKSVENENNVEKEIIKKRKEDLEILLDDIQKKLDELEK